MRNVEIEITYVTPENYWREFFARMRNDARFVKHESQYDEYYSPVHRDFLKPAENGGHVDEWLSIRERGGKSKINYKDWTGDDKLSCKELESTISDAENMRAIFDIIGMKKIITVKKERDIFMLGDFEIAMDYCEGLGYFIEIEVKGEFETIDSAKDALLKFSSSQSLDKFPVDKKGYAMLLIERELERRKTN